MTITLSLIWLPLLITFGGLAAVLIVGTVEKVSAYGFPILTAASIAAWVSGSVISWLMWLLS